MTITIYTFDGTASVDPTKGFPAEVAQRLVQHDPANWNWVPVDYKPVRTLTDGRPVVLNVRDAYFGNPSQNIPSIKNAILNTPGKYVLSGLSQGAIAVGYIYNEIRYGELQSRKDDLIAVHTFGDPFRPRNWTVPLHGATAPTPANSTGALLRGWPMSYGTSTGLHVNPESKYWAWCNNNDAASATATTAQPLTSILGHFGMFATPQSPNRLVMFYGSNGNPSSAGIGDLLSIVTNLLNITSLDNFLKVGEAAARQTGQWIGDSMLRTLVTEVNRSRKGNLLPQLVGFMTQWWPFLVGGVSPALGQKLDPHSQYSEPFVYSAMQNNSKSAVQLAFERLHSLGKRYATTTVTSAPANNKPFQLLTFGKPGEFFDPSAGSRGLPWPSLTAAATNTGGSTSAMTVTADYGRINTDPQQGGYGAQIAAALNPSRVEWVPVSYSSAAFPSVVATDAAVDRAVALVLAAPSSTQFFLSGHGMGALAAIRVHDEFMNPQGRLYAHRARLRGVFNFGNPALSVAALGTTRGGSRGVGAAAVGIRPLTTAVNANLVWEFSAPGDSVTSLSTNMMPEAFNVVHQNVPHAGAMHGLVSTQARRGTQAVNVNQFKDVVLSLYSSAPLAHNSYHSYIPNPKTAPTKSAVQLVIDQIKTIAAA